jgi:hypothetical protein
MTGSGNAFCFGAELASEPGKDPFTGSGSKDMIGHRDTGGVAAIAIWKCKKVTIAGEALRFGKVLSLTIARQP